MKYATKKKTEGGSSEKQAQTTCLTLFGPGVSVFYLLCTFLILILLAYTACNTQKAETQKAISIKQAQTM